VRKFETARGRVPKPVIRESSRREVGIIAYGTSHWAVLETLDQLKEEQDIDAGYAVCGRIRSRAKSVTSYALTIESTWWTRIATGKCSTCSDWTSNRMR